MADNDFVVRDSGERQEFSTGAKRDTTEDKPLMHLLPWPSLERLAWVYTRGAQKYGLNNWQRGMPYSRYMDSALRHISAYMQGDEEEDHLAQAVWNLMSIIWHQEQGPPNIDDIHGRDKSTELHQFVEKMVEKGYHVTSGPSIGGERV